MKIRLRHFPNSLYLDNFDLHTEQAIICWPVFFFDLHIYNRKGCFFASLAHEDRTAGGARLRVN